MNRKRWKGPVLAGAALVGAAVAGVYWWMPTGDGTVSGPLRQGAYVWQRAWTPAVKQAVETYGPQLEELVVLAAQVDWTGGRPRVMETEMDAGRLAKMGRSVGLAIRAGTYGGPFGPEAEATRTLVETTRRQLARAARGGLRVAEVQLDFDCPESKLAWLGQWVSALQGACGETPVTFTALPSWLKHREFADAARRAGQYVLQVHSLDRPARVDSPMTLCDPAAAKAAVERAGRLGVPFRVALPTYGYRAAFDSRGRFLGLSAEGLEPSWPAEAAVRTVQADPEAMAALERDWTAARPKAMQGILWYRLPTEQDDLNWSWSGLKAVMEGRCPRPLVRVQARRNAPGDPYEIELVNDGEAQAPLDVGVEVRWNGPAAVAFDALGGFETVTSGPGLWRLAAAAPANAGRLPASGRKVIGWIRLGSQVEVNVHVGNSSP